mmetsp:Transcript_62078/g.161274  ORF Transcript_62078/g.161274 Transcript_62078/m.161274 type:complete len:231 (+) Transcript_62078:3-695(+)
MRNAPSAKASLREARSREFPVCWARRAATGAPAGRTEQAPRREGHEHGSCSGRPRRPLSLLPADRRRQQPAQADADAARGVVGAPRAQFLCPRAQLLARGGPRRLVGEVRGGRRRCAAESRGLAAPPLFLLGPGLAPGKEAAAAVVGARRSRGGWAALGQVLTAPASLRHGPVGLGVPELSVAVVAARPAVLRRLAGALEHGGWLHGTRGCRGAAASPGLALAAPFLLPR